MGVTQERVLDGHLEQARNPDQERVVGRAVVPVVGKHHVPDPFEAFAQFRGF